jgi:hypothetical protein
MAEPDKSPATLEELLISSLTQCEPYGSEVDSDTVVSKNYVFGKERANAFLRVD